MTEWSWVSRNRAVRFMIVGKNTDMSFEKSNGLVRVQASNVFLAVIRNNQNHTDIYIPFEPIIFAEDDNYIRTNIHQHQREPQLIAGIPYTHPEDIANFIETRLKQQTGRRRTSNRVEEGIENAFF